MAEALITQKRPLEQETKSYTPSPLNPDLNASRTRTREQREKKATFKARSENPDPSASSRKGKAEKKPTHISPARYKQPIPRAADFECPRPTVLTPVHTRRSYQFHETSEHVYNRKGFRYHRAIVDPSFPASQFHRHSEAEPFGPHISHEDASSHLFYDSSGNSITTNKGFRMARANVGAREGRWFWECKIVSGIKAPDHDRIEIGGEEEGGHVRVGWARREAVVDGPVGFDAYSYGLRDIAGQKLHMSRPKDFMESGSNLYEGDVIGLEITLPSLSLHRKVVEGTYNKAVDVSDDLDPTASEEYSDVIRDRVPIRYKTHLYFEQFDYHSSKDLEELMNPSPAIAIATTTAETDPPNPNHPQPSLRTLPFSSIKVYKNGQLIGTPFTDLLAFLPPASKPLNQAGAREGLDDGMLAYFPAVSVFRGGAVETNYGPDFWYPPPELAAGEDAEMGNTSDPHINPNTKKHIAGAHSMLRPIGERFNEQIAEDVLYDIMDEVDFWAQDGGFSDAAMKNLTEANAMPLTNPEVSAVAAVVADVGGALGSGTGEIKEIVQEEE